MARLLTVVLLIVVACLLVLFVMGPRLGKAQMERMNRRLIALRDRAISNPLDTNALNSLIASVDSKNRFERNAAIALLGQIGPRAKPAVQLLIASLDSGDAYDAKEAARSLGEIGAGAKEAVPALIGAVRKHPDEDTGWFAADSLGSIADPNDADVIDTLQEAVKSLNPRMAEHASRSLATLSERRAEKANQ